MRQLPPSRASSGYTPNRLHPLALAPVSDQGERLTDIQAIQRLFANGEQGGYWPADPAFLYEDSAGTIPASVNGVVGLCVNRIAGQPNAVQETTANKPYLRRTSLSQRFYLDGNTNNARLTATWGSSLGSNCTIGVFNGGGVFWVENSSIATSYNVLTSFSFATKYNYNGPLFIINRPLTVTEKALVSRAMLFSYPYQWKKSLIAESGFDLTTYGKFSVTAFADRIVATAGLADHGISSSSVNLGTPLSFPLVASFRLKYSTAQYVYLSLMSNNSSTNWGVAVIDLTTGVITHSQKGSGMSSFAHGVIKEDDYYRLFVTGITSRTDMTGRLYFSDVSNPSIGGFGIYSFTASGSEEVYVKDFQIEVGTYPTEYQRPDQSFFL